MGFRSAGMMIPSLLTTANMALGVFAIVMGLEKRWISAAVAIFVAHFLDILDGRVARWMRQSSRFGAEFDSFADWISFGIAPAFLAYILALRDHGKMGLFLFFLFVFAGAFRLARFNLHSQEGSDPYAMAFTGLPIPGAGGFVALLIFLYGCWENGVQGRTLPLLYRQVPFLKQGIPAILFFLSILMVSRVQYASFKRARIFQPKSVPTFMLTLFVAWMIYLYPQNTIFILYTGYILWGLIQTGWRLIKYRSMPK